MSEKNPVLKVSAIVTHDGKILLMKERFQKSSRHGWNLPGGGWDEADHGLAQTAIREAREETGLEITIDGLYKIAIVNLEEKHKLQFFFVGHASTAEARLPSQEAQEKLGEDIIGYQWFSREEIMETPDTEFISTTIARIAKEYAASPKIFPTDQIAYFDSETKF